MSFEPSPPLLLATQLAFPADAAHPLRPPLTALRLRLEALEDRAPEAPDVQAAVGEVGRLRSLVEDLLALARLERGGQTLTARTVVLCVPAPVAAQLYPDAPADERDYLQASTFTPMLKVSCTLARPLRPAGRRPVRPALSLAPAAPRVTMTTAPFQRSWSACNVMSVPYSACTSPAGCPTRARAPRRCVAPAECSASSSPRRSRRRGRQSRSGSAAS